MLLGRRQLGTVKHHVTTKKTLAKGIRLALSARLSGDTSLPLSPANGGGDPRLKFCGSQKIATLQAIHEARELWRQIKRPDWDLRTGVRWRCSKLGAGFVVIVRAAGRAASEILSLKPPVIAIGDSWFFSIVELKEYCSTVLNARNKS
ncbi:hypothetical protein R3P38DRAFT_2759452 [Favolaschia claudopus]|uniref:Uncharacterized protein n=1 Tax=Favolaschia claudopus TaxID=2862362 RepID=A0AAW0E032_9AGAR